MSDDPASKKYVRPKDIDNRSTFWQRVQWRLESVAWDVFYWWPMKALGVENASRFGSWLLGGIGPRLSQHKTALRNLRLAFPDWSEEQVRATAKAAWKNVGATVGEIPHLPKMPPYVEGSRVTVTGAEHIDAIEQSDHGAVLVSGHFANWEVVGAAICLRPLDCLITYRALNNPYIDKKMTKLRYDLGSKVLAPKGLATRDLMRALTAGRSVGLMNDQKFREGLAIPFFGHEAMTANGPSRMAVRYKVPVIAVSTRRTGPGRLEVTFHPPMHADTSLSEEEQVLDLTTRVTKFVEDEVRANPEQWFWMHRRWPKDAWKAAGAMTPRA